MENPISFIAETLKENFKDGGERTIIYTFADKLAAIYPGLSAELFVRECGITKEDEENWG